MIVKDEAAVIERCLASVRPLIDTWVICDTGSTDDTRKRVRSALAGVPGELHRRPWLDFGANRTELMELAAGAADYLLLLDADMTLRTGSALPELHADAYLLRHAGDLDYAVPRLVRGDRAWRFEGSTHEYLASDDSFSQELLEALLVEHHGDGSSRAEKFERDARLLERDLEADPENARTAFYLAQTYKDLGDDGRAIDLYVRRAALGGWDEEVFYSLYQAGVLRGRSDPDAAMPILLDAWQRRPSRAEPLHELSRLARQRGRHHAAYLFASRGLEIPYPDDRLFVHRSVYEWELEFELAVAAYWVGEVEEALEANERLLAERRFPAHMEAYIQQNRRYCLDRLDEPARERVVRRLRPLLGNLVPGSESGEFRLDVVPAWPQFNPTIATDGDGFKAIVRTANYRIEDGRYEFLDGDDSIRTVNYLVELDRNLVVTSVAAVDDRSSAPPRYPARVVGYEDCRLIRVGDEWFASATVRDRNPNELSEVALLRLDGASVIDVAVLPGPSPGRHEKNWMPFIAGGQLHFLYLCSPTIVVRCDPVGTALEWLPEREGPATATALRGGSQGIAIEDGFLFVAHEAHDDGGRRAYSHRFVLLDGDFGLSALSPRFSIAGEGIEFCAGLARQADRLILTYGVQDRAARIATVDLDGVLGLLEPPR